jgi:hypothetical protein
MNAEVELPRKERESNYWDWVAEQVFEGNQIRANIHKMEQILWRVLRAGSMIDQRVLEVGIGLGLVASTLNMIIIGKWKYRGTDMSPIFVDNAVKNFGFDIVRTDVTCLPGATASSRGSSASTRSSTCTRRIARPATPSSRAWRRRAAC